ncbi:glycoside hydrolase family 16 protein [Serpula lacrymans var. lacrymans S7.3]|uniref:Glycoside hydrolase family 16 protein n=2 Tax=Serpula lacrymans var. lacrymans TaxID=341189 RepID=F8Q3Y7_SERL3|nr:glycoside hydrolase family 16 protein [Serpula lacrymans var. lacrymans S7.9]EGN96843.1 glycoside hydrolase family 16 protein [Serpula lacrymans var. lacrymans S7.3]EGO22444.1 glycoside hydrolase family 16 protein [Serpula lacrymans var. lacrymans S7.9]
MYTLLAIIATALPLASLTGAHQGSSWARHRKLARTATNSTKTYAIQDFYQGEDFFNEWYFFTGADPTSGNVNYQSQSDAQSKGLAYVNSSDNSTVLRVDSWSSVQSGGNRDSVRISSMKNYTGGLFILDASNMPTGCGTWPSFWSTGPNWPLAGEIDIVEGVNNQATNQYTLHSGIETPCTLSTPPANNTAASLNSTLVNFTGHLMGTNCYSNQSSDGGCAIGDTDTRSFGNGFNGAQGGVFALLWENSGMSMWHFARSEIPSDITARAPQPSNWSTPVGYWSGETCNIGESFYEHTLVFDTTICGNWASGAYGSSGCPGTCSDMVANATNFADAQWVINYVAVYN